MFQRINLLLLLIFPFFSFCQNLEKEMNAIFSKMDSSTSVSLSVKVDAFSKKGGKNLYSTICVLEKQNKKSYTRMDDMEFINAHGYSIQIDNSEKYFYIHNAAKEKKNNFDIDVKSLKKYFEADNDEKKPSSIIKLLKDADGIKTYQITGNSDFSELLIELDTKNLKLKKIVYIYPEKSESSAKYIVIDYQKFNFNKSNFNFDLNQFFSVSNGKYKLNTKYSSYKLITE